MLGVSLRLPEAVDIATPLRSFIQSNYTAQELAAVTGAVNSTQALRAKITMNLSRNDSDSSTVIIDLLSQYMQHLQSFRQHFPFGNSPSQSSLLGLVRQAKIPTVKIQFVWYESFRHTVKLSDYDLNLELGSVLFNLAAIYSRKATQIKALSSPSDDSPIRESCKLFQQSAGMFEYIANGSDILPNLTPATMSSVDLSPEGLAMLAKLMLAQAQACFFEKSTASSSPSLIAKLASGVSELFKECVRLCQCQRLKSIESSNDSYHWGQHCHYQQLCYAAASHYWFAKSLLADEKYGDEIAHLERARIILDGASKLESILLKNLTENRVKLLSAITNRLIAAMKDNDTIYYATIPRQETIKDIESVVTVKPLPYQLTFEHGADPFQILVSPLVKQQNEELKLKFADTVTGTTKTLTEENLAIKSKLSSLGLPSALEALNTTTGLSEDLWQSISDYQYKGGKSSLESLYGRIDIVNNECENTINNVSDELNKEKIEDSTMRLKFNTRWNRRPSDQLTSQFNRDLDTIKKYLSEARKSNGKLKAEIDSNGAIFEELMKSRREIEDKLPKSSSVASSPSGNVTTIVAQLHALLDELSTLTDSREKLIATAKEFNDTQIDWQTISKDFTAGKSKDAILADLLDQFHRYQQMQERTELYRSQQSELLERVSKSMVVFNNFQSVHTGIINARQQYLQSFNSGVLHFNRMLANLNEGLKFYGDLQLQRIAPLKQRVEDFIVARNMEKSLILEQLTMEAAGFSSGSGSGGKASSNPFDTSMPQAASQSHYANNPNLTFDQHPPNEPLYRFPSPTQQQQPYPQQHSAPPQQPNHYQQAQSLPQAHYQQTQQQTFPSQYSSPATNPFASHPSRPSPPPAASADDEWSCASCTYLNPPIVLACQICGTERGSSSVPSSQQQPFQQQQSQPPYQSSLPPPQPNRGGLFGMFQR